MNREHTNTDSITTYVIPGVYNVWDMYVLKYHRRSTIANGRVLGICCQAELEQQALSHSDIQQVLMTDNEALQQHISRLQHDLVHLRTSVLLTYCTDYNPLQRMIRCLQCFDTVGYASGRASGL